MLDRALNDNDVARPCAADAHGQAAILLTESLLHGLIERQVITVADAIEIVEVAAEVEEEMASELRDPPSLMRRSMTLLASIRASLKIDLVK